MASIHQTATLEVSPEVAWDFLERYTRSEVHAFSACISERQVDDYRVVTTQSGEEIWERNVTVDPMNMRAVYAIPGLRNCEHHQAEMRVLDEGTGKASLVWVTDFLPHSVAEELRENYQVLLGDLVQAINAHQVVE